MATKKISSDEFDELILSLQKKYKCPVMRASQVPPIERHPTGIEAFDRLLDGGLPKSRMLLFYGPERCGKTSLGLAIAKSFSHVLYIDADRKVSQEHLTEQGSGFVLVQPTSMQEALEVAVAAAEMKDTLLVIDTIAALASYKEYESKNAKDFSKVAGVGELAGLLNRKLPVLVAALARSKSVCIVFNQIRDKLNVRNPYENPFKFPGGHQLKHLITYCISMWEREKRTELKIGTYANTIVLGVEKSSLGPSWTRAELGYVYDLAAIVPVETLDTHRERLLLAAGAKQVTIDKPRIIEIMDEGEQDYAGDAEQDEDG